MKKLLMIFVLEMGLLGCSGKKDESNSEAKVMDMTPPSSLSEKALPPKQEQANTQKKSSTPPILASKLRI